MYQPKTLLVLESLHGPALYRRIWESEIPPEHLPPEHQQPAGQPASIGHQAQDIEPSMQLPTHDIPDSVKQVAQHIQAGGGRPLLVGGSVRDKLHNEIHGAQKPVKDFDVEVYGMHPDHLEQHLGKLGKVDAVGKSFGVLKLVHGGEDFDISVPRRESKVGKGHKGFIPKPDPSMTFSEAAKRRDFTMNAVSMDPLTGHVFDPHGGVKDIKDRVLRHTDKTAFAEDPLRILRGAQFAARFGMKVHPETMGLMQKAAGELPDLPKERVGAEWHKLLMKGEKPSHGLDVMHQSGALETLHPELHGLIGVPQEPEYHPEGDVWTHTKHVVDRAAEITKGHDPEHRKAILYAALLHDIAKPHTTETTPEGRITSHGHEEAGSKLVEKIFPGQFQTQGMGQLLPQVARLVGEHLKPSLLHQSPKVSDKAIRKLAKRLHPASIEHLVHLAHADHTGRGEQGPQEFPAGEWLREKAQGLQVHKEPLQRLHIGKFAMSLGVPEGPQVGAIQREIDKLQEKGQIKSLDDAKQAAKAMLDQQGQDPQAEDNSFYSRVMRP